MEKLGESEILQGLTEISEWKREEKIISRRYKFGSFPDAVAFVNQVAKISEEKQHHPFIAIDYKMVTLRLTSWHAGGLTGADFEEAKAFDDLYTAFNHPQ